MNQLRETEAIMALHELNYSNERIAELLKIHAKKVTTRINLNRRKPDTTIESLQEQVEYWRRHAEHYRRQLGQQRTPQAVSDG